MEVLLIRMSLIVVFSVGVLFAIYYSWRLLIMWWIVQHNSGARMVVLPTCYLRTGSKRLIVPRGWDISNRREGLFVLKKDIANSRPMISIVCHWCDDLTPWNGIVTHYERPLSEGLWYSSFNGRWGRLWSRQEVLVLLLQINPGAHIIEDEFRIILSRGDCLNVPKLKNSDFRCYLEEGGILDTSNGIFYVRREDGAPFNGEIREEVICDA